MELITLAGAAPLSLAVSSNLSFHSAHSGEDASRIAARVTIPRSAISFAQLGILTAGLQKTALVVEPLASRARIVPRSKRKPSRSASAVQ